MPGRLLNNRIWRAATRLRAVPSFGYALAIASFAIALFIRFTINDYLPTGFPFLTFFPAVLLTAFIGGTRPGILCAVLSTCAAYFYFIAPGQGFYFDLQTSVALFFFITVMAVDLFIIDVMTRSLEQLQAEKNYSHELLDREKTLFLELQHRVANNLGFVSNLLSLQRHRIQDEAALSVIEDARVRMEMMSRVHRRLYDPKTVDLPLATYFKEICDDMIEATSVKNVTCRVQVPDVQFDLDKTLNLSLVLIEAVTNSLKHAFTGGQGGEIVISVVPYGLSNYVLTVQDNGKGFPDGFDPAKSERLGFRILTGFARSLGGEISYTNDNGGQVKLVFTA